MVKNLTAVGSNIASDGCVIVSDSEIVWFYMLLPGERIPITAVTDFIGVISKELLSVMPRVYPALSISSISGWQESGRSP